MLKRMMVLLLLPLILIACEDKPSTPISKTGFLLGTVVSVSIYDSKDEAIFDDIFDKLEQIESKMSKTIAESEVSRLNRFAMTSDNESIEIDEEVFYVIQKAIEYGEKSDGRFDITLAPIVDLWGIGTEFQNIPENDAINEALMNVGLNNIEIVSKNKVKLKQGTQIDLGGIAKGYAADCIVDVLKGHGVNRAIINLGGNVKVLGSKKGHTPFSVGLQDPLSQRNDYLGILSVKDKTVVTSGDYERYFEAEGVRYHHIFDPNTGYPYQTNVASVTVITEDSIVADAMSTILYLMDVRTGVEFVNGIQDVECIYVTKDKKIYLSDGDVQELFELTNTEYSIENINNIN